ncbi:uncharacterized protein PFL1_04776 [Pseudozyma flocculosa PF-1]|uniref:Related to IVY1 - phospholipid-binding protein n=2 Tax=Pseudozyma flocculosa TaxID=84751 RepID=A0A5C3F4G3_9BASI|nr:uncharacterized protein PFL1_04776 [Pseudozyma flocculosa PF-1]EPQ27638.1 hypothetical protein PFL1_04776 [Pseudozyma flocculosa PF-1]SPO39232.1 related to IVY1 - phospholipid-binding protein [Pseudozyma flocculosa]
MPGPRSFRSVQQGGGPPSPSLSSTTRASLDFPSRPAVLITRADLRNSLNAYEKLLTSAKAYTNTMLAMAKASSDFACALEECARVKGAHDSGAGLQAASGLHFLKSNYEQVLCDTFWKDFSIPLLSHYDTYRAACNDRQLAHDKAITEKSKQLKEAEARNMRTGRRKERDLNQFRRALQELQAHVDELDELKAHYYHEVLESEEEVWEFISSKVALVVRSQIEISERISSKGLSDPILEPMLSAIPDPFGSYGPPKQDDQIFSILPPTSLLSSAANSIHGVVPEGAPSAPTAGAQSYAANGAPASSTISPASLMSPTTPSRGLSRPANGSSSAASPSMVGQSPQAEATPTQARHSKRGSSSSAGGHGHGERVHGHAPQLSAISDATTSVATSESSVATTGLFGSESMDFEELLDRDREKNRDRREREAADPGDIDSATAATASSTSRSGNGSGVGIGAVSAAASRLQNVLSIIDEDAGGPLATAPSMRSKTPEPEDEEAEGHGDRSLDRVAPDADAGSQADGSHFGNEPSLTEQEQLATTDDGDHAKAAPSDTEGEGANMAERRQASSAA